MILRHMGNSTVFPLKFYEIKSNRSEYQRSRAFIIIIKEAGRKSVQYKLPDFGSYSTNCADLLRGSLTDL